MNHAIVSALGSGNFEWVGTHTIEIMELGNIEDEFRYKVYTLNITIESTKEVE